MTDTADSRSKSEAAMLKAISNYTPPNGMPYETDKKAHFFDYMAKQVPYKYVPHNLAVRAINGLGRTPSAGAETVKQFADSLTGVRKKLLKNHTRDLYVMPGFGARASVDAADRVPHHQKLRSRIAGATMNAVIHADTINPNDIKDPKLRSQFLASKQALGTTQESVNRLMRLLPAKSEDKKEKA